MASRLERLRSYKKMEGPKGESHDMRNLDYWSARASENSNMWHRAKGGEVKLPSTGGQWDAPPYRSEGEAMRKTALRDLNHLGSDYEKNVRRSRE